MVTCDLPGTRQELEPPGTSESPTRILLVEDSPGYARWIELMLSESVEPRFDLRCAESLGSALPLLSGGSVDLLLLDLSLPDSSGLDTFIRARAEAPSIPIVVLTGLADDALAGRALRAGAQDYLPKDQVDARLLIRSIRYAIERQHVEETLRESADRVQTLSHAVEQSRNIVVITDTQGEIEYVNPRFTAITGFSAEDVAGTHVLDLGLISPEDRRRIWTDIASSGEWRGEIQGRKESGETYREEASISAIRDPDGSVTHFIKEAEDVSHQRTIQDQLRHAQKMEAVGRLAGGVAHDFNNLLMVIMGYTDFILRSLGPDESPRKEAEEIRKAADRAASLTRQLLTFSRRQVLQPRVLDLNAILKEMEKMLRRLIGEHIELVIELDPSLEWIKADPGELEQVLMNLTINSRDAMPEGGRLSISTANVEVDAARASRHVGLQPGRFVMLSVADTGCGMDRETVTHIFEPFFTTKDKAKGTGLGLSTVYAIIKHTGGDIQVQSQPGMGTTFRIYLPAAGRGALSPAKVAERADPIRGVGVVLLVEDEKAVRDLIGKILQAQGYTVLQAHDAAQAERIGEEHQGPIHLLVTDVVMPGLGGRQLAERLRIGRPEMRVLYMSGYNEDAVLRHGVQEAAAPLLQKPFTPEDLARKVNEILQGAVTGS